MLSDEDDMLGVVLTFLVTYKQMINILTKEDTTQIDETIRFIEKKRCETLVEEWPIDNLTLAEAMSTSVGNIIRIYKPKAKK